MAYFLISVSGMNGFASRMAYAGPTRLVVHAFDIHAAGTDDLPPIHRRIQFAAPPGWTPTGVEKQTEMELVGPNGEGFILVFAGLHPSQLTPLLRRMRKEHPSAEPTPPEHLDLPGIRTELGERATRFRITGRETGEMVLIERRETIVLVVTIVDPAHWPRMRKVMEKVYRTVSIVDVTADSEWEKDR